jgi:hypothetical protein
MTVPSWGLIVIGFMKAAFGFRFAPLDFFLAPDFLFEALLRPPDFRAEPLFAPAFFFVAIEGVSCWGDLEGNLLWCCCSVAGTNYMRPSWAQ